jgi:hypothetical protein
MSQLSRRTFLALAAMASRGWAQPKQTTVVLLLTGVITDGGWSQLAFNGLRSLARISHNQDADLGEGI